MIYTMYNKELEEIAKVSISSEFNEGTPSEITRVKSNGEHPPLLRFYIQGMGYSGGHDMAACYKWPTAYPTIGYDFPTYKLVAWRDATSYGAFTGYYPAVWAYYAPAPEDLLVVQSTTGCVEVFGLVNPDGEYENPSGFFNPPALVPSTKAIAFANWARGWVTPWDPPQELFNSFLRGDPPWRESA